MLCCGKWRSDDDDLDPRRGDSRAVCGGDAIVGDENMDEVEPAQPVTDVSVKSETIPIEPVSPTAQDNSPPTAPAAAIEPPPPTAPAASPPAEAPAPAPLFRTRNDLPKAAPSSIPPVIPILRPPDDPGVDEDGPRDEFAEQIGKPRSQAGGWRGFWSRLGG